ncbi:MAG: response regulator [Chloroflexi bacterium]|nr:response regulator [Chloroflexota bacterium]MBI4287512.1 response regulator [Chloroflexota bacterium]
MARVLMIEDNIENLDLMSYLLLAWGHTPIPAQTGHEGIEMAHKETPDLILCDILLPDYDGYQLARTLKKDPPLHNTPVVAVTALAMVGDREKVLKSGFDGYIPKPINPETFIAQVETFLSASQRGGRREQAPVFTGGVVPTAGPPSRNVTILVVDNAAVNLALARDTLEPAGFRVITAQDPDQALKLAHESPPDLILSDVHMPGYEPLAFLKAVKSTPRLQSIPFVFISGTSGVNGVRQQALALGAAAFILRPIEPQALVGQLEQYLGKEKAQEGEPQ